jgi:hypothetical protein
MTDLINRRDHTEYGGIIKVLRHIPRTSLGLGLGLPIAPGEINATGIAKDQVFCRIWRDIATTLTKHNDQLNFVMQIVSL